MVVEKRKILRSSPKFEQVPSLSSCPLSLYLLSRGYINKTIEREIKANEEHVSHVRES